jgi:hypothetical protein
MDCKFCVVNGFSMLHILAQLFWSLFEFGEILARHTVPLSLLTNDTGAL